jgi:uncharacterized membrane protein
MEGIPVTPRASGSTAIQLALAAVSTSLVCVVTMVFSINVPDTRGFFNIGETMIYAAALLFGPVIGAFAGGVGAGFADLLLGYWYYAPATLVIKALEGGIVGILGRGRPRFRSEVSWKTFTFGMGLVIGVLLAVIGSIYYSGMVELRLGIPPPENPNVTFMVPPELWYLLGAAVIISITLAGFVLEPEFGWLAFSTLVGGVIMVTGYFLYQNFLLLPLFNIEAIAVAEIPINIGQMLIGLVVALPIVRIMLRSMPQLKRGNH